MSQPPRISVITASYNQGAFIGETIESVLAQDYPDVEHIVVDGMSTDSTPDVLAGYPHLRVVREPDKGQADAINKGFRMATGQIWCFLNSDDTFLPGALDRVAREIDPAGGRHIVMGRCRLVDEHGHYAGIEHPSHFESYRRVLEVWKGHLIPQPAVFWTPEVWTSCGPLDPNAYWLDYDLFCRFAQRYPFHMIDQVLATYRLHSESKTESFTDAQRLEDTIRLSRRYWGSPLGPLYWQLTASLAAYRLDRTGRANRHYNAGLELARQGHGLRALGHKTLGTLLAPDIGFYAIVYPRLRKVLSGAVGAVLDRLMAMRGVYPQTAVYMDRTEVWNDGWAGPRLIVERETTGGEDNLLLQGTVHTRHIRDPFVLTIQIDDQELAPVPIHEDGWFGREIDLPQPMTAGRHRVEVRANGFVVYHRILRNRDYRPLAWLPANPDGIVLRSRKPSAVSA